MRCDYPGVKTASDGQDQVDRSRFGAGLTRNATTRLWVERSSPSAEPGTRASRYSKSAFPPLSPRIGGTVLRVATLCSSTF